MLRFGVLIDGGGRDELTRQLVPLGAIDWIDRADTLVGRATEGAFDVVLCGLHEANGRSVAPTLVELAAYRPSLPVILHTRLTRITLDALLAVFAPGLRLECAIRPFARLAEIVGHVLSASYRPGVSPLLLQLVLRRTPESIVHFIALGILMARERRTVEELAAWAGVSARTIDRRLQAVGWASPHVVLHSFTALDAVWLISEYRWSARRVQLVRGFPHPSSVTRLLATYAGTRPSTLAEDGGFAAAFDHVMRRLTGND